MMSMFSKIFHRFSCVTHNNLYCVFIFSLQQKTHKYQAPSLVIKYLYMLNQRGRIYYCLQKINDISYQEISCTMVEISDIKQYFVRKQRNCVDLEINFNLRYMLSTLSIRNLHFMYLSEANRNCREITRLYHLCAYLG